MDYRERVLQLARKKPVLPSEIAKALETNSILAGAMLSELSSKGHLKVSTIKVGGSPLYYVPGNESQLLDYTSSLNEKDRRTLDKLKDEQVIREQTTDPLTRVSLAQLKDFAYPLIVQYDDKQERFYKWFALSDADAEGYIRTQLGMEEQPKSEDIVAEPETPKAQTQEHTEQSEHTTKEPAQEKPETPKETKAPPKQKTQKPKQSKPADTSFWDALAAYFKKHNIDIDEKTMNKKNDFDLILRVPTPLGNMQYYCKAHSKKRINDGDLSSAYVKGQMHKLPVIFLTDGDLTKKAQELEGQLKGFTVSKL